VIQLAFYLGTKRENPAARLFDRLVCWRTGGRFSHVEVVDEYLSNTGFVARCLSSSFRDGGVRSKVIDLDSGRWVLKSLPGDPEAVRPWFTAHMGEPYDWFGLFGWVLPWRVSNRRWWFCSEAVAEAMGLPESWRISPNDLHRRLTP
jgi:hypothetical protein